MSSPQGRFAAEAALLDGATLLGRRVGGQAPVPRVRRRPVRARPPRPDRQASTCTAASRGAAARSARCGCGWSATVTARRTPTCAAPRSATWSTGARRDEIVARLGPDPLRPDADPTGPGGGSRAARAPIGDLLMDQEVLAGVGNVYRAEVLFRHRIHPLRPGQHAARRPVAGDVGRPGRADGRGRAHRPHRHRAARAHARGDGPAAARRRPRRRGLRLPPHRPAVPRVRRRRSAPTCSSGRNIFWCPQCQRRFRSRALQ